MEPDAVQTQNKPFECRVILLGALKLDRTGLCHLFSSPTPVEYDTGAS